MKEPGRRPAPDLIAGADILDSKVGTCGKCRRPLLVGKTRDGDGTLRWHNFESEPRKAGVLLVFARHMCAG